MRSSVAIALLLLAGCQDKTAILVEVNSPDLVVPDDVDELHFIAMSDEGTMADQREPLTGTWPYSLAIYPGNGSTAGTVDITVTGLRGGVFAIKRSAIATFEENETVRVTFELTRSCLGVRCSGDLDCIGGLCGGQVDGGMPDAGTDASLADAATDARTEPDARILDAGCMPTGAPERDCDGMDENCNGVPDEGLPCVGSLVISELATSGPSGGIDEFVEIHNVTDYPINLFGVSIEYRSSGGASYSPRTTLGMGQEIPAHGYYLAAGRDYSRAVAADDMGWNQGLAATGGHIRLAVGGVELDRIGWGTAAEPEGTAQPELADDTTMSYERKALATSTATTMEPGGADESGGNAHDTDDNAADFVHRSNADPQSSASAPEAP